MTTATASAKPLVRVVAAIIEHVGRFFLAKRPAHKAQAGLWEFPGGKVLDGEDPRTALARELHEELGVERVVVGERVGLRDHDYGPFVVQIDAYLVECDPTALRCLEHQEVGWFAPSDIKNLPLAPADEFLIPVLTGCPSD